MGFRGLGLGAYRAKKGFWALRLRELTNLTPRIGKVHGSWVYSDIQTVKRGKRRLGASAGTLKQNQAKSDSRSGLYGEVQGP